MITKTDWEVIPVSMDMTPKLGGEQLTGASTLIIEDSDGNDVTAQMVSEVVASQVVIYATVSGGTGGCTYTLRYQGVTNMTSDHIEIQDTLAVI